jgi:sugar diacid utilization regulator
MLNPARARRMADAFDKALQKFSPRRLIDIRDNKVTIVFSDARRTSGWTAPTSTLALRVTAELNTIGNSALAGISNDVPSTSQIPMAHREANLALDLSNVSQRVVQFSEVPIQSLLLHLAGEEFQRIKPGWHAKFLQVNNKQRGALIKTLRTYADANMNVLKTAELLSIHPNTIYARFDKIFDITGLDAKNFHSLNELLLVADCNKSN